MQFIISAKAGLVNAVEGSPNVRLQQQVAAGEVIKTGSTGRVEILLNPGTFFRLGEDSEAVLDSVDLTNIQLHILSGSAVIECGAVEKDSPIRVADDNETVLISKPGTYRFPKDSTSASLDDWNQQRSEEIAAANQRSAQTDSALNNQGLFPGGQALYPGSAWPYTVPLGAYGGPFSFFSSYGGGYSFYQPLVPIAPIWMYRPVNNVVPRPTLVLPRPTGPRPVTSVPRPPSRGSRISGGHR
jgi:hypothetical protein